LNSLSTEVEIIVDRRELKRRAACAAVKDVRSGMILGLGTGSTAYYAVLEIGEMLRTGRLSNIVGVATSKGTEQWAREFGIPLTTLNDVQSIDITIDGADEVDPDLNMIKGGGGALLREKIVASVTKQELIVVDDSKLVDVLGMRFPLPVEVVPFGWKYCFKQLERLGFRPMLRMRGEDPYVTDQGNYILDCHTTGIMNPMEMEKELNNIPGVVENGLFIRMADKVIVASPKGIETYTRQDERPRAIRESE